MYILQFDWWTLGEKLILIEVIVSLSMLVAMYSTYAERKVAAFLQDRIGPNRAGPFGLFQPLADGLKLFMKEEIIPLTSSKFLFVLGPMLAMITAMLTSAVIPWGSTIDIAGHKVPLQIADINIGVLYIFGVVSLGVYGIMIGGWASNNKFSLLAAIRGASQMISYELAMGLSLIAVLMISGSLRMSVIVNEQIAHGWNIIYQPLGFLIFFICALAECNRTPFDLAEAENELNFGYHQEYSSMKLGFYLFAEYSGESACLFRVLYGRFLFKEMTHGDRHALYNGGQVQLLPKCHGFPLYFFLPVC
jgi:NADH-quinone oxidoreductase subunit H